MENLYGPKNEPVFRPARLAFSRAKLNLVTKICSFFGTTFGSSFLQFRGADFLVVAALDRGTTWRPGTSCIVEFRWDWNSHVHGRCSWNSDERPRCRYKANQGTLPERATQPPQSIAYTCCHCLQHTGAATASATGSLGRQQHAHSSTSEGSIARCSREHHSMETEKQMGGCCSDEDIASSCQRQSASVQPRFAADLPVGLLSCSFQG